MIRKKPIQFLILKQGFVIFSFVEIHGFYTYFKIKVPSWLTEMIDHPIWRNMLYQLAEEHPNCLMLNFTIKVVIESGLTYSLDF